MSCETIRPRLGEWIVGALDSQEASMIDTHVRDCRDCAAETEVLHDLEDRLSRHPRTAEPPAPGPRWSMRMPMLVAAAMLIAVLGLFFWNGTPVAPGAQDGVAEAEWVHDGWKAVHDELNRVATAPGPIDHELNEIFANLHARVASLRTRPAAADIADRLGRARLSMELMLLSTPKDLPRFKDRFPANEWKELTDLLLPEPPPPQLLAGHFEKRLRAAERLSSDLVERMKGISDGPGEIPLAVWALDAEDVNPIIRRRAQQEMYRRAAELREADLEKLAHSFPKWHARIECVRGNPAADHPAEAETIVQVDKDGTVRVEGERLEDILELAGKLIQPAVAVYAHPDVTWDKVIMVLTRTMHPKYEKVRLATLGGRAAVRLAKGPDGPAVREELPHHGGELWILMDETEFLLGPERLDTDWKIGDGSCPKELGDFLKGAGDASPVLAIQAHPRHPAAKVIRFLADVSATFPKPVRIVAGK